MIRKKLKLEELKVQSFITELQPNVAHTAKGGDDDGTGYVCIINSIKITYDLAHQMTLVPKSCTAANCNTSPGATLPDLGPSPTIAGPAPTIGTGIN